MSDEEFLLFAMKGDAGAARLVKSVVQVAGVWDDLIDRDKPVTDDQINEMMWNALVEIPSNPWYARVSGLLLPLIQMGILNWHLSNRMRKVEGLPREIAHVIRYSAGDIALYLMFLIGGKEWVMEHGPEMRVRMQKERFWKFNEEARNEKDS